MAEPTPAAPDLEGEAPNEPVAAGDAEPPEAPLVEDDLLVEDVSIDGMCGVY
jgi:mycofactocin precursor